MAQYTEYASVLESCLKGRIMIILLIWSLLIVTIVALLYSDRKEGKKYKNDTKKSIFSIILLGVIGSLAVYFTSVFPIQRDIRENAYETYTGEFYVDECYGSKTNVYITIKCGDQNKVKRYTVLCDVKEVENYTTYNGIIVYSKHSKYLLNIDLNN